LNKIKIKKGKINLNKKIIEKIKKKEKTIKKER